jgi:hypothetical protein
MRITILQPNYIPWRGYFDFFKQSDAFVVYDDVQYTKNDWRNRNLIKSPDGVQWLTIPVDDSNRMSKYVLIKDVKIIYNGWPERHLKSLEMNYKASPYFDIIYDLMEQCFNEKQETLLALDMSIITKILDYLGIKCKIYYSSELGFTDFDKTERLVKICTHLGATEYLSGDAAKSYLDVDKFGDIRVLWHRYKEKVYPQLWSAFISRVSMIDLLMNCGIKGYDII